MWYDSNCLLLYFLASLPVHKSVKYLYVVQHMYYAEYMCILKSEYRHYSNRAVDPI